MSSEPLASDAETIELRLLFEGLAQRYGYDFRGYSEASLRRRVATILAKTGLATVSTLQHELLHRREFFEAVLPDLTITTSEMFRDPPFFRLLREEVLPVLRTYPTFKIWHAGCGGGEEVYSLAIMLEEEGLLDRATIYATDINPTALQRARAGIFPVENVKLYTQNYQKAGGRESFSRYYTASYGAARFAPELRRNVLFSEHSLVSDDVFTETQVILCRNVLIYFQRELQNRVLDLFTRALTYKGHLCLGSKETLRFLDVSSCYEDVSVEQRIFRKIVRDRSPLAFAEGTP